ncbi:MAG TPA: DUF72 domain-containing protein [Planctomycetota bacterium]|nr:DUF72 domain-containing protein [Planctomycetota bacterium]
MAAKRARTAGDGDVPPEPTPLLEAARAPEAPPGPPGPTGLVRFGTSSFSWADWVGPFYPPGTEAADYLRVYAQQFDTVEVDATYYAIPSTRTVDGWVAKTPEAFLLAAKFPRSIVHGGEAERPDPARVLVLDAVREDRDRFLATMRRLGTRLGPLVLQFPYFNRTAFASPGPFLERLDAFLADLPRDLAFGVEVRNKAWVGPALREVCARHKASLVLVDQAWMPHGDEVERTMDVVTGEVAYVRLLGDRQAIEKVTTTWEREVVDHGDRIARWADLLVRLTRRGVRSLVYVNNHYAGHAPTTTRRLRDLYLERLAAAPPEPEQPAASS